MSAGEELNELREHAEAAEENKSLAPVSFTMAIIAVLVATVSLLGHRAHTEEVLLQNKATDEWAYYQAKNLRRNNLESLDAMLGALEGKDAEKAEAVQKHFEADIERYGEEQKEIKAKAEELESELQLVTRRANRFDLGEVFTEIALVVTSITLLTRKNLFWMIGMMFAAFGIVIALNAFLLH